MTASLDIDRPDLAASAPVIPHVENRKRNVALRLTVLTRQLWQRFDRRVERIGVSSAKWRLIAAVGRRPGTTQRLIAELLEISDRIGVMFQGRLAGIVVNDDGAGNQLRRLMTGAGAS